MNFSVIIPSKTAANLIPCVQAVQKHEPDARVIVVDDGVEWTGWGKFVHEARPMPAHVVPGIKPFIFARNVNLGILVAGADDVVLLNDDALLATSGGFTALSKLAERHPEFGVISAATNLGGLDQQPRNIGLREVPRVVAYVCCYLPRRTLDTVGLLDERFGGTDERGRVIYGWEDNDHCRRIRNAGLKLGVYDGCFVDHGSLCSTFRGDPRKGGDIEPGRRLYIAKWGDCN